MTNQTVTRQIELPGDRAAVLAVLTDTRQLPHWATPFADRVEPAPDDRWTATKDGREFPLDLVVSDDRGTVDYLRDLPSGRRGGAYIRVFDGPRAGTIVVMTIPVPQDSDPTKVDQVLASELQTLAKMV